MRHAFSTLRRFINLPQYIVDAKLEVAHQTDILNQRLSEMKEAIDALASNGRANTTSHDREAQGAFGDGRDGSVGK